MKKIIVLFLFLLPIPGFSKSFWVVQNIGTLTFRLYEKDCKTCNGKLILQSPMIVGKNEIDPKTDTSMQTQLGLFYIEKWHKFYVDNKEAYIPWDGRKIPKRGSSRKRWGAQGAFGVYTATLSPRNFQHLHGTIGWPNESARFIEHQENKDGTIARIGSHGCTRINNQLIMFLRNFIPEKTPVLRIYAKETKNITSPQIIEKKWTYVFYETKDLKSIHPLDYKNRPLIKENNLLEVGDFVYSNKSTIEKIRPMKEWNNYEINGNPYEIKEESLQGSFNIDTGLLSNDYKHPKELINYGNEISLEYIQK